MSNETGCNCNAIGCDGLLDKSPEKKAELTKYIDGLNITDNVERNRGYLIQSLHKAQELYTFLPESVQMYVANKLQLHLTEVYGVISFYSFFTDKPVGKYRINICTGTACHVRGASRIHEEFSRYLALEEGETSEDGKFSLASLRCVGACSLAPVVMVNEKVYGNVTPKMVADIINECE